MGLKGIAGALYFIQQVSELGVITLKLDALNSHEVTLAWPGGSLGSTTLEEFSACCREENKSDLKPRCENFIKILRAKLVENFPLNINDATISNLEIFILNCEVQRVLLWVSLSHRRLLIIIHALHLIDFLQIWGSKYLLDLLLLASGNTELV